MAGLRSSAWNFRAAEPIFPSSVGVTAGGRGSVAIVAAGQFGRVSPPDWVLGSDVSQT